MSDRTCSKDGCGRPHSARGLCHPHYKQHMRQTAPKVETSDWYVYALIGKDNVPRYIGSSKDPAARAKKHYSERNSTTRGNVRLYAWLRLQDKAPRVIVLQEVLKADRFAAEERWTNQFRQEGFDILNINSGSKNAPENLAKMRAAQVAALSSRPLTDRQLAALEKARAAHSVKAAERRAASNS